MGAVQYTSDQIVNVNGQTVIAHAGDWLVTDGDNAPRILTNAAYLASQYSVASAVPYGINVKDSAYGAKGDGVTDDSAAINAAIAAGGSQGFIILPAGNYIAHDLIIPSGCWLVGSGYEVTKITLKAGFSRLIVTSNFDTLTGTGNVGSSPFNFSIVGVTLDGNKANQTGQTFAPAGLAVGQAGTPGSTTRYYSVTTVVRRADGTTGESEGCTIVSTATSNATLDGTNYDTLSWTATTPASGATVTGYNIYDGASRKRLNAALVVGTSYNVQSSSAVAGVHPLPSYNTTSGIAVAIYGYGWSLRDVRIRNGAGVGLWTEWAFQSTSPGNDSMESFGTTFKVLNCAGGGWVFLGSHDTQADNFELIANGTFGHGHAALAIPLDGIANGGSLHQFHIWGGTYDYGCHVGSSGIHLADFQIEGASNSQLWITTSINKASNGKLFAGGIYEATTKGFTLGAPGSAVSNINMNGIKVENCGGAVGDISYATNVSLEVYGQYYGSLTAPTPAIIGNYDNNSRVSVLVIDRTGFVTTDSVERLPGTIDATNIVTYTLRANQSPNRQETVPRAFLNAGGTTSNGFVYFSYFTPDSSLTVGNFLGACRGTAAVGATLARMGLYTVDGSNNLACVARSANCAAANANIINGSSNVGLWTVANKLYTTPIVDNGAASPSAISSYTLQKGQRYAMAFLVVGTTTAPQLDCSNIGVNDLAFQSPIVASVSTGGQTDLASSYTSGNVSGNGAIFYGAMN